MKREGADRKRVGRAEECNRESKTKGNGGKEGSWKKKREFRDWEKRAKEEMKTL